MKKVLIVSFLILSILVVGCGNKQKEYEKVMKEYAKEHYEKYMSGWSGVDVAQVSISLLKNANEQINANYDLSKLEKCTDESYVNIILNKETKKIENFEFHLDCK